MFWSSDIITTLEVMSLQEDIQAHMIPSAALSSSVDSASSSGPSTVGDSANHVVNGSVDDSTEQGVNKGLYEYIGRRILKIFNIAGLCIVVFRNGDYSLALSVVSLENK